MKTFQIYYDNTEARKLQTVVKAKTLEEALVKLLVNIPDAMNIVALPLAEVIHLPVLNNVIKVDFIKKKRIA